MKTLVVAILLLLSHSLSAQDDDPLEKSKRIAHLLEQEISSCPKREVVASFPRKRKTAIWTKSTWGPPTEVFTDLKKNDSLLYPYAVVVEFWLDIKSGAEFLSQEEAKASQATIGFGRAHYRNTYLVGDAGVRQVSAEILPLAAQTNSSWEKRHIWADACWDNTRSNANSKGEEKSDGNLPGNPK